MNYSDAGVLWRLTTYCYYWWPWSTRWWLLVYPDTQLVLLPLSLSLTHSPFTYTHALSYTLSLSLSVYISGGWDWLLVNADPVPGSGVMSRPPFSWGPLTEGTIPRSSIAMNLCYQIKYTSGSPDLYPRPLPRPHHSHLIVKPVRPLRPICSIKDVGN